MRFDNIRFKPSPNNLVFIGTIIVEFQKIWMILLQLMVKGQNIKTCKPGSVSFGPKSNNLILGIRLFHGLLLFIFYNDMAHLPGQLLSQKTT